MKAPDKQYNTFAEFYPYYLSEHSDVRCRVLHYIGSSLVIIALGYCLVMQQYWGLLLCPLIGYGFAWVGHFFFEHNRPATFTYPVYSFVGDWVMLFQFFTGRLPHEHFKPPK